MPGKYKLGFDIWGLLLFLGIMVPNFIWFAVPVSFTHLTLRTICSVKITVVAV